MGWRRTLGLLAPVLLLTVGCGVVLGSQGAADMARQDLAATPDDADPAPVGGYGAGSTTTLPALDAQGNPTTSITEDGGSTATGQQGQGTLDNTFPAGGTGAATNADGSPTSGQYVVPPTIAPDIPTDPTERQLLCEAWAPVRAQYLDMTSPSTKDSDVLPKVVELRGTFSTLQARLPASARTAALQVSDVIDEVLAAASSSGAKFNQTLLSALSKAAPVVRDQIIPAVPPECTG